MTEQATETTTRRKPGRPKGSTSKPKADGDGKQKALVGEVITDGGDGSPSNAVAVVDPKAGRRLTAIASSIRKEFGRGIDTQFAIGRLLNEARELIPGDREFGQWVGGQGFGFSQQTANRLQAAAKKEPEVRAFIAEAQKTGRDISPTSAIKELSAGPKPSAELKDVGKRVRDLLGEPLPTNGWASFKKCAEELDLSSFSVEELAEFATTIQNLVAVYGDERKRRSA